MNDKVESIPTNTFPESFRPYEEYLFSHTDLNEFPASVFPRRPKVCHIKIDYEGGQLDKEHCFAIPLYDTSSGPCIFIVRYEYNIESPNCLENQLLRAPQYRSFEEKRKVLDTLLLDNVQHFKMLWPQTATGVTFRTNKVGNLEFETYEDESQFVGRRPLQDIDLSHQNIQLFPESEVSILRAPAFPDSGIWMATVRGRPYLYKRHDDPMQNDRFKMELDAHLTGANNCPHVLKCVGLVYDDSNCVQSILYEVGTPVPVSQLAEIPARRKMKWATQIIHALLELHRLGIAHGNIHLMRVLLDSDDNAKLFSINQGAPYEVLRWPLDAEGVQTRAAKTMATVTGQRHLLLYYEPWCTDPAYAA